ncbi:winged helix-turn-helix domain-containing protein [Kribbella deserti]|uniref:Helix-turn-helix domain-containing protein n=1 Tax=Kribbella deserti TaxID=1926257 RepID=A0ABV6QXV0_9ACTN
MIRIRFEPADLGRVTFRREPDPLWDAALAARALRDLPSSATGRAWRRQTRAQLRPEMKPLLKLISPGGAFPNFLTPELDGSGLNDAIEELAATPAEKIRADLVPHLPAGIGGWIGDLLDDRPTARRQLGHAVRAFHTEALAPWAATLEGRFAADLAIRSRALLTDGVEGMLAGIHPDVEWRAPELHAHGLSPHPSTFTIELDGRGLLLYPSALVAECLALDVPGRRPVLVYPAAEALCDDPAPRGDHLADLLGRTRASVLRSLGADASTTQLARRTGISLASASEHARVLRNAGLVTTHRAGGVALHALTPAGTRLLRY